MENRDHKYFTRSKITGQRVHYIVCEKCANLVPVHLDKFKDSYTAKKLKTDLSQKSNDIRETLPKRKIKIISSRSNSESDSESSIVVNDSETIVNDSNKYSKKIKEEDTPLVTMLVKLANKRLKEKLGNKFEDEEEEEFEIEPFENLHNDIHYTVEEREYVKKLDKSKQEEIFKKENHIMDILKSDIPIRFKILNSDLNDRAKANVLSKVDHFYTLDPTDNEYQKLLPWVEQLDKIPFGKYCQDVISRNNPIEEIQTYLSNTKKHMDNAVYGHETAKTQILSVIAREISNPNSGGNSIAIQGPMGNGKTTLVKDGVCKAMNRPFGFIPLGGMQDSSYLIGHEVTYEGSKCGRIVEILTETNCMNPVIFFDELDKVSETPKGDEIMNLLCHLTDASQNKDFHDKYFSGIPFDLSKATFIFSYNDESKINPILLDRMTCIRTKGFDKKEKTKIVENYVLPKTLKEFGMSNDDVTFEEDAIHKLIESHCKDEKGVRNLKRNVETIVAKLNITRYLCPEKVNKQGKSSKEEKVVANILSNMVSDIVKDNLDKLEDDNESQTKKDEEKVVKDIVNFTIDNFKLPYTVKVSDLNFFLDKEKDRTSFEHMYM